jgi:hypothetical protein
LPEKVPTRLRNALSAGLIALACLLVPFGVLSAWVAYGLADTGRYVTAMAPLAGDPAVQGAVADTVGDGILQEVAPRLDRGAAGAAVRPFVQDAVRSFTRTEAFRTAWVAGNRAVHDAVLDAVRAEYDEYDDRPVTVDLAPVTAQVKRQLTDDHVPMAQRIPVAHTRVAVLPAQELERLRKGYGVLEVAGFWLPVAAGVLAVAGVGVAVCRRRAVAAVGVGTAVGGGVLALAVAVGRRLTLGDLPEEVHRPAAGAVYDALTATLRTVSWGLVVLGVSVVGGCWVVGRVRRRREAPPPPLPVPSSKGSAPSTPAGASPPAPP